MEQGSSSGPRATPARGTKRRSKESLYADQIEAVRRKYNIKYLEARNEKDRPRWLCMECGTHLSVSPSCPQGHLARHARTCKGKATSRSMRARIAENSTPNRAENFTTALAANSTPTLAPDAVTERALCGECDDVDDSMACDDSWPTPELATMPELSRDFSPELEHTVPVAVAAASPHPQAGETVVDGPRGCDPAAAAQNFNPITSDMPSLLRPMALASIPLRLQQPEVVPDTPTEQYVEADEEVSFCPLRTVITAMNWTRY